MITFELKTDYIELFKLLKAVHVCENGGQAKFFINEGLVKRNNKIEKRKRAKILKGEIIEIFEHRIKII